MTNHKIIGYKMEVIRGLVKLKKKNPGKIRIGQKPFTHPLSILNYFGKLLKTWKQHKKYTQKNKFPKKLKIWAGAWHTHPLPIFSRIFSIFF